MKNFLKTVVASFTGMALLLAVLILLIAIKVAKDELPSPMEDKTLLTLDLRVPITDRAPKQEWSQVLKGALNDGQTSRQPLRAVVTAIREAADDDKISGLFLKGAVARKGYASGWAALKEVREAIIYFKSRGKPVITWQDEMDEATLYVTAPADELMLNPLGTLEFNGFASEIMYFKPALEKYGVDVQVTRVGKYKSAVEPFLLEHMSPENREQLNTLLDDMLHETITAVAQSRNLPEDKLRALVQGEGMLDAKNALAESYVTAVGYYDQVLDRLRELTGTKAGEEIKNQKTVHQYFATLTPDESENKVAVIYAEGEVVAGDDEKEVAGDYIAKLLRKAREDDDVKAVVMRVNSPGGSASASDIIQRETRLLARKKPFFVSMGTVAASGGYWISSYADKIYAEPNTITGSIGVFGMYFNVRKLANELGLNIETARTSPTADVFSMYRSKTPEELQIMQRFVDFIYDEFLSKVSEGRKLDKGEVHKIAQGRVWSGSRAKTLGLVDQLGGLNDTIAAVAKRADLGDDYVIEEYQKEGDLIEDLFKEMSMESQLDLSPSMQTLRQQLQFVLSFADRKGVYARLPYDLAIH